MISIKAIIFSYHMIGEVNCENLFHPENILFIRRISAIRIAKTRPWSKSLILSVEVKRKRGGDIDDMPTPETPYGSHLGPDPSPATKKYYKR